MLIRKPLFLKKVRACMIPALSGICIFYLIPFIKVLYYSLIKGQYQKKFVGLENYMNVLKNDYFQMACKNTILQILFCVPIFLILATILSILYSSMGKLGKLFRKIAVFSLLIPSFCVVSAFYVIFERIESPLPIYLIFLWKYIGIGIILITASIAAIPIELYEAAKMDGASVVAVHSHITLPLCLKTIGFTSIMSIVYNFRIFRESYLYYDTQYPPEYSYTLQYYLNNQFLKLNYQTMAAASVLITLAISLVIMTFHIVNRRGLRSEN